ncbi:MAG: ATP-binding protein [Roseiflexaceae bacterium]
MATLHALAEIGAQALEEQDLPELYDRIVQLVLAELHADGASLMRWDEASDRLSVAAVARARCARPEPIPLEGRLAEWVATRCEALLLDESTESPELCSLLGYDNVRSAVGVPLIGQGRVLGVLTAISRRSQAAFSIADRDLLALLASQTTITIERVGLHAAAARDRAERQRSTQQLAQSEKLAGLGRLVAAIAHEINNPLHAIHNSLHLLQSQPLTDEKRERYLGMTQEQVERLIVLVQRILNFYQPSRDGMRLTSIHPLLMQVLRAVSEQVEHSGIVIERDWAPGLPRVMVVASHLRHVFQHLTLNAIEAMPQGGHLVVRTRVIDEVVGDAAQAVLVEFSDDGPGIPDSEMHTIFEPFYTTKRRATGLGLAISYSIVERHGGLLSVRSGGEQTTFRVTLPALDESSAPAEHAPALTAAQRVEEQ